MAHPPPTPERPVRFPVMYQQWNWLTFLHWTYDPTVLRPLVPQPLELDTFDGAAWVGITPFLMEGLRAPGLPSVPWLSRAPETNVRTYVRAPDGQQGIWFFSLDHARLPAVTFARATYFLPYMWSSMSFRRRGPRVVYRGRRRWPGPPASYDIAVEVGDPLADRDLDDARSFPDRPLGAVHVLRIGAGPGPGGAPPVAPPPCDGRAAGAIAALGCGSSRPRRRAADPLLTRCVDADQRPTPVGRGGRVGVATGLRAALFRRRLPRESTGRPSRGGEA
jgi:uncharacterized protein DUF2071